jgi:hypothetical protein
MGFTSWNFANRISRTVLLFLFSCFLSFSLHAQAQNAVSGNIMDDANEALPGATVTVKGTTTGSVTDLDGNYRINASSGDTLVFSFVGMAAQEMPVGNQTIIDILLLPDNLTLDEIVVVGYGTMK